ncbi:MAG: XisI protein [Gemmataceae bacterium]|nr:XisI protein [Gemmataceae bacterium]MCI0741581.1 XisI protein [Gemmataceae bacterium]
MDTVNHYRHIIEQTLLELTKIPSPVGEVLHETVFDRQNDHYLVVNVGWGKQRRIYGALAHIDLVGDKVWIQHDGTEEGLANQLREAGIPAEQIVLGYRIPEVRKHTGYAVA